MNMVYRIVVGLEQNKNSTVASDGEDWQACGPIIDRLHQHHLLPPHVVLGGMAEDQRSREHPHDDDADTSSATAGPVTSCVYEGTQHKHQFTYHTQMKRKQMTIHITGVIYFERRLKRENVVSVFH